LFALSAIVPAKAQTCLTQSQITAPERDGLASVARKLVSDSLAGRVSAVQATSTDDLQKDFSGVGAAIAALQGSSGGVVTVREEYILEVPAHPADDSGQFDCASSGPLRVSFHLPGLKPGRYAVVFTHVTGTPEPRQVSLVLQDISGWKLAGFFQKPLVQSSRDGLWYWQLARQLSARRENWDATLAYQLAQQLDAPVEFFSSANLEKLTTELASAQPADFPTADKPLQLQVEGKTVKIQGFRALVTARNTPGLLALVTCQAGDAATNAAIGVELQRKLPELTHFLQQLLVQSGPNGETTAVPVGATPAPSPAVGHS
jgi:hypothetical protein